MEWMSLEDFENDKSIERTLEKGLMVLFFLVSAFVGYVLTHYLRF
jgi:hypothetical protein